MREALVDPELNVQLVNSPIPQLGPKDVLIKVICAGTNPKDWKYPVLSKVTANSGDDVAGIVEAVGEKVFEFKSGDRVAAFHQMRTPGGAFAEFAVAPASTTIHLPDKMCFEEAATIPLAGLTAAIALYQNLALPVPWLENTAKLPLLVYGGSSAIGTFAIKLAVLSNIHPIIVVAGKAKNFIENMLDTSKGDAVVDYREGILTTVTGVEEALRRAQCGQLLHAFDTVSGEDSMQVLSSVLVDGAHATFVLPEANYTSITQTINTSLTYVGIAHIGKLAGPFDNGIRYQPPGDGRLFAYLISRYFGFALAEGHLSGHPYQVVSGGLNGLQEALRSLQAGKNSAFKYVLRVNETT